MPTGGRGAPGGGDLKGPGDGAGGDGRPGDRGVLGSRLRPPKGCLRETVLESQLTPLLLSGRIVPHHRIQVQ